MRTRIPLARRVIAALLMVLLTACHSWEPTTISPQQVILEEALPSSVRVTLTNEETITLTNPTIRNDSITGIVQYLTGYRRTVAVSDISRVEVRRVNPAGAIGVGLLASFALFLAAAGIAFSGY